MKSQMSLLSEKYIYPLILSALAVLAPIKSILIVTGVLIFSDLITGVMAARKRGEEITSAGLRRTLSKIFIYNFGLINSFLVDTYMLPSIFMDSQLGTYISFCKLVSMVIGFVELKSILENLNTINGEPIFKTVINKLGSVNDSVNKEPPK